MSRCSVEASPWGQVATIRTAETFIWRTAAVLRTQRLEPFNLLQCKKVTIHLVDPETPAPQELLQLPPRKTASLGERHVSYLVFNTQPTSTVISRQIKACTNGGHQEKEATQKQQASEERTQEMK